jgi:hypothetical protein
MLAIGPAMSKRVRAGQQAGALKAKTIHALGTKSRIHAIVGQVIDELERRRAKGKSDYIVKLADEVEEGGLPAWKSLKDLLPADDVQPAAGGTQFQFGNIFVAAVREASARQAAAEAPAIESTALPIIDVPASTEAEPAPIPGQVEPEALPEDDPLDEW